MNAPSDTRRLCALVLLTLAALWARPADALGRAETATGPLRAAYAQVRTEVDGDVARTTVTQVFVNDLPAPVEASYGIALPADATLTGFAEWRDGVRTEAVTRASEVAEAAYDAAADKGERAALVAREGAGLRLKLMAIPAHGTRRVELRYAQTLSALGGERTYVLPADGAGVPVSALDVEVRLQAERPILKVAVPNQPEAQVTEAQVTEGAGVVGAAGARSVHLNRMGGGLERDLVVRWQVPAEPLDLAARVRAGTDGAGVFEARFAFNADEWPQARRSRDVVVVVDTSVSMSGGPLRAARAAAAAIIEGLDVNDRLEVVAVADGARPVFGKLVSADGGARALALDHVASFGARGRTDLQGALDLAAERLRGSSDGLLVLLTDGQPTLNAEGEPHFHLQPDLAALAGTRTLVGLFNYPGNAAPLRAAFADLTVQYVPDGPAGAAAIADLARRAVAPVVEDFALEVEGAVWQVAGNLPARLPMGDFVRLVGRAEGPLTVTARGVLHGVPFERQLALEAAEVPKDLDVSAEHPAAASWAGDPAALIKHLRAGGPGVAGGAPVGDGGLTVEWARLHAAELEADWRRAEGPEAEALAGAIRHLGTRYGVATRFTSYVLTDSLAPDHIKPGDPEIRVHAPPHALRVFAILPWGEVVDCAWSEAEGLWLGRFLVPRGVVDGLYRARLFVVEQGGTQPRGALHFKVDSQPPALRLELGDAEAVLTDDVVFLRAVPVEPRLGPAGTDRIDRDPIDLKTVVVQLGDVQVQLERVGEAEIWEGFVPVTVPPGRHVARLVATDYARNTATAELTLEVGGAGE